MPVFNLNSFAQSSDFYPVCIYTPALFDDGSGSGLLTNLRVTDRDTSKKVLNIGYLLNKRCGLFAACFSCKTFPLPVMSTH